MNRDSMSEALDLPIPRSAPHTASVMAIPTKDTPPPSRYTLALSMTSGEAAPNSTLSSGWWNKTRIRLRASARIAQAETVLDAALETIRSLPLPLYCATTTVPPVDMAIKTLTKKY